MQIPNIKDSPHLGIIFFTLILCSVWNIPHTIGIRYLAAMILIGLLIWKKPNLIDYLKTQTIFIILCIYLLIHIFFISDNLTLAIKSFNQEWLKFIIFTLLGASIGIYFFSNYEKDIFLWLGCAFSTPLIIHLVLVILKTIEARSIPYGYSGYSALSESHGDFGYTALQSSIFLLVYIFLGTNSYLKKSLAFFLLFCCILSPYLAQSRGGLIFITFSILLITAIFYSTKFQFKKFKNIFITTVIAILICIFSIKVASTALSSKWVNMGQRIELGLMGDPIEVICSGTQKIVDELNLREIPITNELKVIVNDVNAGTAARLTVARAGVQLLLENPMGINGSKNAYQSAISQKCSPIINMANTHNGWLDLALALGIPGLLIFLMLFINYSRTGIKAIKQNNTNMMMWGLGLTATATIWILRGILDATSRDQMLEMQAFCLALFSGLIFQNIKNHKKDF
jgi:O-antigen ligase